MEYTLSELTLLGMVYACLGWCVETAVRAVRHGRFINPGILNLPLHLSWGAFSVLLLPVLATMNRQPGLQFLVIWISVGCGSSIARQLLKTPAPAGSRWQRLALGLIISGGVLAVYLMVHPLLLAVVKLMNGTLKLILAWALFLLTAADLTTVLLTLNTPAAHARQQRTRRFGNRLGLAIRSRLDRAYPGILEAHTPSPTFAGGLCFDKLVWVFLISSFLGALIEMVYCRLTGGVWMSRSSVLYGPFSIVWGLGAVVLTVALRPLAGKHDRHVFLAGFFIGGVYEYLCSVFTELVFGTVFWDYSHMPLNIGGRTNVLYCIFWGLLAVVWVKILCPPMERGIEKIPPLPGKILTWVLLVLMLCNGLLTGAAMLRYTGRQIRPEPVHVIEEMLDESFDDDYMERRWPNMRRK